MTCQQWLPATRKYCGRPARRYAAGHWLCDQHTPARQNGRPEPPDPKDTR